MMVGTAGISSVAFGLISFSNLFLTLGCVLRSDSQAR